MAGSAHAAPVHLRCEGLTNPLGMDAGTPHFAWQSDNLERDWRQTAYQILVAGSADRLRLGQADVWDSGKLASSESTSIAYGGPPLDSRRRYYWTVRVWDSNGRASEFAPPAWWETGLRSKADWSATWISWKNPQAEADRAGVRWIWAAGGNALDVPAKTSAVFRLSLKLAQKPQRAALFVIARGDFTAQVNGHETGAKHEWGEFDREDVGSELVVGENSIEVTVSATPRSPYEPPGAPKGHPAALAALLKITQADGSVERIPTGEGWQARLESETGWKPAAVVAELNDQRLGGAPGPISYPAALLRREFSVSKPVRQARLYVTALGNYRVFIDGRRVGESVLTPGFTDFRKRVLYQTYDVTGLVENGKNAIGAMLGDGWYASGLTWAGRRYFPFPTRLLAQLEIEFADGSRQRVATDELWKASESPILRSEIYAGEVYDARLEQPGWAEAGFDDAKWAPAVVSKAPEIEVSNQSDVPVRVAITLPPKNISSPAPGVYVFDMGQNMVGWVTLRARGDAGTLVRLRFAEILKPDGNIYRQNLRNADAEDLYYLRGGGQEETYTPYFTFHGFRYVEVTGYPGKPALAALTGEVATSTAGEPTGRLETSSKLLNEMWSIGIWGQRGNFLSVPTDCPQRDERLGWMGDAGVFWRTGSYNFDVEAFSHKWMQDVADAQTAEGAFTNISPDLLEGLGSVGAPGWGDAGVIVPYTTWLQYGDAEIVREHWNAMERWMDFIAGQNPDFLRKKGVGPDFGDWLAPDPNTPKDLVGTAYWALIAGMMSQMAQALGKEDDAKRFAVLVNSIRDAFEKAYLRPNGEVAGNTQTAYVLALHVDLAPKSLEPALLDHLVQNIASRGGHLSTGFLGTPFLLFTLADHGRSDVAYRLLFNTTYPSWGYMLAKGATTWWERWNGDTGDPAMNSYNHYAFGSVVAWIYRAVAGIDTSVAGPGFHEIVIRPHLDARLTWARGEYDSAYGRIVTDWRGTPSGPFTLNVTIPANTTAKVYLPAIANAHVTEDGKPIAPEREAGDYRVEIGSGVYAFEVK